MLTNKNVLVTGGSGYIGSEICRTLREYNAHVFFSYNRNQEKAEKLATETGSRAIQMNIENVAEIKSRIEQLTTEIGHIDILVNNAAISQILPLSMLDEEDVDKVLNVNLKGTLFVTKFVIKSMIRNKRGSIVNMGSIAGHRILDVPVTYAMTKAAISGFTISLASELRKFGIRVNSVVPGMIEGGVSVGVPEELKADFIKHCVTGRVGKAREVAELVCFLASDKASYINSQNIMIDGGI
jgi:NAD(P)-dependent dehydrogenase (short-subunit alcohol dehydrogenase family)